jgi:hypothetical protein
MQLVVKSHGGGRSGALPEESETTAHVTVVTDALYTNHGDAECPACRLKLSKHKIGEASCSWWGQAEPCAATQTLSRHL